MLYIVSTPIGNLKDLSFRAVEVLKDVEYILAEDTRRTSILLSKYDINKKLISYNDMNKEKKTKNIINDLLNYIVALVSDCGTPGISDPGFYLVRECVRNNILISPIPGPTAFVSALVCSGLPTDKFTFYGFLPKKEQKKIQILKDIKHTTIFYESPHRLLKTLVTISKILPEKKIIIGRELTKKFETFYRGTARELLEQIKIVKGEIVLIIGEGDFSRH